MSDPSRRTGLGVLRGRCRLRRWLGPMRLRFRHRPVVVQVLLLNCAVALLVNAAVMLAGSVTEYRQARQVAVIGARADAELVADGASAALVFDDRRSATETLGSLRMKPSVLEAELLDADGLGFARYGGEHRPAVASRSADTLFGLLDAELRVHQPVIWQGETLGLVVLRADLTALNRQLLERAATWLAAQAAGLATVLLTLALLLPRLLRPLTRLSRLMSEVSQRQDYGLRAKIDTRNEVGRLAGQFNAMLAQIQQRDATLERELAEKRIAQERLAHLAHHDPVTGLPNRHHFNLTLERALSGDDRAYRPLALLFIDLDNFKSVNDTLGHQAGDELLRAVAHRIGTQLRASDVVCRVGGDEFTVVLDGVRTEGDAQHVAGKILESLAVPLPAGGTELYVGASIGVALADAPGLTREVLVQRADIAMYHAKARGKGAVQAYREEMNARVAQRSSVEQRLRKAIESGTLDVHYQPQVSVATGRLVGVEALLRWTDAELGEVSPELFVPVAEENGLILELGRWVLERACRDGGALQAAGCAAGVTIAVNVSARQLADAGFLEAVFSTVAASGLPPSCLELELTESALLEDIHGVQASLEELRSWGVRLAIDDFGSGYSSLRYLKRLPIQRLKIDREFVAGLPADDENAKIARAVIRLAHSLGMEVVAEGVETQAQRAFLAREGCEYAQGFLFARPQPLARLLARQASLEPAG